MTSLVLIGVGGSAIAFLQPAAFTGSTSPAVTAPPGVALQAGVNPAVSEDSPDAAAPRVDPVAFGLDLAKEWTPPTPGPTPDWLLGREFTPPSAPTPPVDDAVLAAARAVDVPSPLFPEMPGFLLPQDLVDGAPLIFDATPTTDATTATSDDLATDD